MLFSKVVSGWWLYDKATDNAIHLKCSKTSSNIRLFSQFTHFIKKLITLLQVELCQRVTLFSSHPLFLDTNCSQWTHEVCYSFQELSWVLRSFLRSAEWWRSFKVTPGRYVHIMPWGLLMPNWREDYCFRKINFHRVWRNSLGNLLWNVNVRVFLIDVSTVNPLLITEETWWDTTGGLSYGTWIF